MPKYLIEGKQPLGGEVSVSGAKNMALKVLVVSLLTDQPIVVKNVPEIEDVSRLLEVLAELGVRVNRRAPGEYELTGGQVDPDKLNYDLVAKFRASLLLLGPLLARFSRVRFPHPGGCTIGKRPIDMFLEGFAEMGVTAKSDDRFYTLTRDQLRSCQIVFPQVTVTGTETMVLAAVLSPGTVRLVNCAQEPEVTALLEFLNRLGADISGIGSSYLTIKGVTALQGGEVTVIPDRLEAGSFMALALAAQAPLVIRHCDPEHLSVPLKLVANMGAKFTLQDDAISVEPARRLTAVNIKTHEYPGFPTDIQAPFTVLMTQAHGQSLIHETIFEGRLFYTDFLVRMGANIIMCDPQRVLLTGPAELRGKKLESPDLRAGIAMVIAGLVAHGTTEIENIYQIERGYENLVGKLTGIGARIQRVDD